LDAAEKEEQHMQTTITAKLKLMAAPEQIRQLRLTRARLS
jgi:hypothetical protein